MSFIQCSEPNYLSSKAATRFLSTSADSNNKANQSTLSLSSTSLKFLNGLLDELLHLSVYNSVLLPYSSEGGVLEGGEVNSTILLASYELNSNEVLTNQQIKSGFLRVLTSNSLVKASILEAEIAIRSLLRTTTSNSTLHLDPSLLNPTPPTSTSSLIKNRKLSKDSIQTELIFRELRESIFNLSGFSTLAELNFIDSVNTSNKSYKEIGGVGGGGKKYFKEVMRIGLKIERTTSTTNSEGEEGGGGGGHIKFLNSFYTERILSTILEYLLKCLMRYIESNENEDDYSISSITTTTTEESAVGDRIIELDDIEIAFKEDINIWNWLIHFRIKSVLDENKNRRKIAGGRNLIPSGMVGGVHGGGGGGSIDSFSSNTSLLYASNGNHIKKISSIESNDGFEDLMKNNDTKKFSLTPNRLKVAEKFARSSNSNTSNVSNSYSLPNMNSSSSPIPIIPSSYSSNTLTSTTRKLQPRTPIAITKLEEFESSENQEEDEEDLYSHNTLPRRKLKTKESLMDLLKSDPPWKVEDSPALPTSSNSHSLSSSTFVPVISKEAASGRGRKLSITRRKTSVSTPSTSQDSTYLSLTSPTSTPMKNSNSNSSIQSNQSGNSYKSSNSSNTVGRSSKNRNLVKNKEFDMDQDEEEEDLIIVSTPKIIGSKPGGKKLTAKDDKDDLLAAKKANEDLVAFLSSPPPMTLPAFDPFRSDAEVLNGNNNGGGFRSLGKKSGLVRGLISKIGGKKIGDESNNDFQDGGNRINNNSSGRATSTIIRSLGRKTSKMGLLSSSMNDSESFSTNTGSSSTFIPKVPNIRSSLTSSTVLPLNKKIVVQEKEITPTLVIETTPPSPTTTSSNSSNAFTNNSVASSKPPGYTIPNYTRPSPLPNNNSRYNNNMINPASTPMGFSKSFDSMNTTTSRNQILENKFRNNFSSEQGLSLATASSRAGPMRSLSVGNLDTQGIITTSSPVNFSTSPSPPSSSISNKVVLPIPTTSTPIIDSTPILPSIPSSTTINTIPTLSSPSPRTSITFNRTRRGSNTSNTSSITSTTTGTGTGGITIYDAQTNFKPVPLQILNSSIFSGNTTTTNGSINSTPNSSNVNLTTATSNNSLTSNNPISPLNSNSTTAISTAAVVAAGVGVGIISTASVLRLSRSSSTRVKVPKFESSAVGSGTTGNSGSRDSTPSPTASSITYLLSTPEEVIDGNNEDQNKELKKVKEEKKEKEENFPLLVKSESFSEDDSSSTDTTSRDYNISDDSLDVTNVDLQSTLFELKKKMENATSTLECMALLEQLMNDKSVTIKLDTVPEKKKEEVHRSILPQGIPILVKEKDLIESDEKSESLLVEFFLSGGDLPYTTPSKNTIYSESKLVNLEGEEETKKVVKVDKVENVEVMNDGLIEEKGEDDIILLPDEVEEEKLKMPGGM